MVESAFENPYNNFFNKFLNLDHKLNTQDKEIYLIFRERMSLYEKTSAASLMKKIKYLMIITFLFIIVTAGLLQLESSLKHPLIMFLGLLNQKRM